MTELSASILALLRQRGDRVIRARDLYRLPEAVAGAAQTSSFSAMRYVDQTCQRMRRRGEIVYCSKGGWMTGVQALRDEPQWSAPLSKPHLADARDIGVDVRPLPQEDM